MGEYFNPPLELRKVGRSLNGSDYNSLQRQLREGEQLYGLYDRGIFFCAPLLGSPEEWEEFDRQYMSGLLLSREFYAVSA